MAVDIASSPNVNTLWARFLIDELARCGVRYAVVSPGSRSTPLTFAVSEHPDITDISILDERSAAFFALGLGRQMRVPAVLICTSGTAGANYFPAVCEAQASRVPMIVLTADRPVHLRNSGAPQTMDQQHLYGSHANWFTDLPQPEPDEQKLRSLRSTAAYAVAQALGEKAGPVHLNVPLRKPLEPTAVPEGHHAHVPQSAKADFGEGAFGRPDGRPFTLYAREKASAMQDSGLLLELLGESKRPVILAGPDPQGGDYADALIAFAEKAHIPVLAEGISNVRFAGGDHPLVIDCADIMLRSDGFRAFCAPDLIIRTGGAPTNKMLQDFVEEHEAAVQVQIGNAILRSDPAFVTGRHILADPKALFERVIVDAGTIEVDEEWAQQISETANTARSALEESLQDIGELCEAAAFHEIASLVPDGSAVMLSNSMPVRDWETWAQAPGRKLHVYCNRGVNGIDGVTSTALGIARARGGHTVLVAGDLAFLHDLNALWAARAGEINATVIVINNNGGEIFGMLPVRNFDPPFEKHFTTSHNLDLAKTGELFGIEYYLARNAYQLQTFLNISLDAPGLQIIEIPTDREQEKTLRKQITGHVAAAVDGVLNVPDGVNESMSSKFPLQLIRGRESDIEDEIPALLLHGFTRSSASWTQVVSCLERKRDYYLADLMGHGASPAPRFEDAPEAYSLEHQSFEIEKGLKRYGLGTIHLCGYSMGGRTALLYALEHPERIASLTLVSASPGVTGSDARAARRDSDTVLADSIPEGGLEAFVDRWTNSEIVSGGVDEDAQAEGRRERLLQRAEGLRGSLLGMGQGAQPDLWDRLAELRCSVQLILGRQDEKYVDVMSRMAERIPNARLHIMEDTGHDVVSASPMELATLLDGFWNECEGVNR